MTVSAEFSDVAAPERVVGHDDPETLAKILTIQLEDAVMDGNVSRVIDLIEQGVDVNALGEGGEGALHFAATMGNKDVLLVLLGHGHADPNLRNRAGTYPVHVAALYGKTEAALLLIERGAKPGLVDEMGRTAVDHAIAGTQPETATILQHKISDDHARRIKALSRATSRATMHRRR